MLANPYFWLKLLHVAGVVAFVGNITVRVVGMALAARSGDARVIAHAVDAIGVTDRWITRPAALSLLAGGIGAAWYGGLPLVRTGWIAASFVLLVVAGAIAGTQLAPLERRIRASLSESSGEETAALLRRWQRFGTPAVSLLWIAIALMVLKWPN